MHRLALDAYMCQRVGDAVADMAMYFEVRSVCDELIGAVERRCHSDKVFALERSVRVALAALDHSRAASVKLEEEREVFLEKREEERAFAASLLEGVAAEVQAAEEKVSKAQESDKLLASRTELCRAMKGAIVQWQGRYKTLASTGAIMLVIPDRPLKNVFAFLGAKDVLFCAQVCRTWYFRVDRLFAIPNDGGGRLSSLPTSATPIPSPSNPPGNRSSSSTPPPSLPVQRSSWARKSWRKKGAALMMSEKDFKGMSVANMKRVIALDKTIKELENECMEKSAEMEDLNARLSTELTRKDFLVKKIKDVEYALAKTIEQREQAKAQAASDREVINFLDLRTQELESSLKTASEDSAGARKELENAARDAAMQRDMLEAERKRGIAADAKHKMEKKLLIKEVKTLRLQIQQMRADMGGGV